MFIFEKIAEERIEEAITRGEFDHLEGMGQPLKMDEDFLRTAPELRIAYKILKNANILPPEVETLKEIERLEDLLTGIEDENEKVRQVRKINLLVTKFNLTRNTSVSLEKKQFYLHKLGQRLMRD
jgi:hypothetical protein